MNIFGIGPLEILFVLVIGILVLGPEGMVEAGRKLGKFIRSVTSSAWWQSVQSGMDEVQNLPYKLMREAEYEEWKEATSIDQDDLMGGKMNTPKQSSPADDPSQAQVDETGAQKESSDDEQQPA